MKGEDQQELKDFVGQVRKVITDKLVEKGWTLPVMARELDMNYRNLCLIVSDKHAPNTRTLVKILTALDLKLEVVNAKRD